MGFFLGIDAGGTKTRCVLTDESGEVVARCAGPGANLARTNREALRATLASCFAQLARTAGLEDIPCQAVGAGFAGVSEEARAAQARQVLSELLPGCAVYVLGDLEVALEAAVGGGPGVVLIAGTGSVALGRNQQGQMARAGGEGPHKGDAGSGFDIARRGLLAVLEAETGEGPATVLAEALPAALSAESVEDLSDWARPERATEVATLAPVVVRAARRGDPVAQKVVDEAARALAALAQQVLNELGMANEEAYVALSGGVFAGSGEMVAQVSAALHASFPRAQVERLEVTPAEGAARLAQRRWLEAQAEKKV